MKLNLIGREFVHFMVVYRALGKRLVEKAI